MQPKFWAWPFLWDVAVESSVQILSRESLQKELQTGSPPLPVTERLPLRPRTVTGRKWQRIVNPVWRVCAPLRHSVYCTGTSLLWAQGAPGPNILLKWPIRQSGPQWLFCNMPQSFNACKELYVIHHIEVVNCCNCFTELFLWTDEFQVL